MGSGGIPPCPCPRALAQRKPFSTMHFRQPGWSVTWRRLFLQQDLQPIEHERASCALNGWSLYSSWNLSASSLQKDSLVNASGSESHEHPASSMASWRPVHVSLHHLSASSLQKDSLVNAS